MNFTLDDLDLDVNYSGVDLPYEWRLKIVTFANNTADFIMQKIKHSIPKSTPDFSGGGVIYPKTLSPEDQEQKRLENLERAVRRAKKAVHYSVRQISADHLLTLTTRENITDRGQFFELFTRFIRLVRTKQLINGRLVTVPRKNYPYVAVPELQDRGAFHMHVAVTGRQDIKLLRACWYVALGGLVSDSGQDALGQVDVQYRKKRWGNVSETFQTLSLVRYMTKYIDKDFDKTAELGQHRYLKARDIPHPTVQKQFVFACCMNGKDFADAIIEVSDLAHFVTGIHPTQMIPWNRGQDIFILRAAF